MMTQTSDANNRMNRALDDVDPQIGGLLRDEAKRQATGLELIPSENLVSEGVLEAMGSKVEVQFEKPGQKKAAPATKKKQ